MLCPLVADGHELSSGRESADSLWRSLTIDEVEVTARYPREEPVIPVQRLEGKALEALNAYSVADAVRYFSGIQLKDFGGIGGMKTVDLRSMGSHHLGVFYDGVEIGNAQNGVVDLGKFAMDNIESISLYNGQKSELLQPAKDFGSAGTLYIRSRRPLFTKDKAYNVEVGMQAGTFGLAHPSVLYEQQLTEHVHLSMNASFTYATGRYHFRVHKVSPDGSMAWDTTGVRQNGDVKAWRGEVGLYGYLPQGKWHVKGYYYDSEKGLPRAIIRNVWTSEQRQWDRNIFVQGQIDNTWRVGERRLSVLLTAKYSYDRMRYLNPDTTLLYVDNDFRQQEVYVSGAFRADVFRWWEMALSADYIYNHLDSNKPLFVYPRRHTGLLALSTAFHYRWFRLQATALGTLVSDRVSRPNGLISTAAPTYQRVTPSVALSVQPLMGEQLYIRGFYKHIFRLPTFNDLYYDILNTSLQPEYTKQYDGGIKYTKTIPLQTSSLSALDVRLKADGYYNTVSNKIIAVPRGNSQYRWQMMNIGYVEIRGVDVNVGLTFHFAHAVEWSMSGSYTYQKAQDFTDPAKPEYGGQIAYIPWHAGSATTSLRWRGWAVNYSFIYVGERYHTSANIPANRELPWFTHDMSIQKLWQLKGCRLMTAVEVNNMLNQQYAVVLNYPMPGVNGKVVVRVMI